MENRDDGHAMLLQDLKELLEEAETFEFHDFKNTAYATPKVQLVKRLNDLIERAKDGIYDNSL